MSPGRGPSVASGVRQDGAGSESTSACNSERKCSAGDPRSSVLTAAVRVRASLPVLPCFHVGMRVMPPSLHCRKGFGVNKITQRDSRWSGNRRRPTESCFTYNVRINNDYAPPWVCQYRAIYSLCGFSQLFLAHCLVYPKNKNCIKVTHHK